MGVIEPGVLVGAGPPVVAVAATVRVAVGAVTVPGGVAGAVGAGVPVVAAGGVVVVVRVAVLTGARVGVRVADVVPAGVRVMLGVGVTVGGVPVTVGVGQGNSVYTKLSDRVT